jgi:hypothetical protein
MSAEVSILWYHFSAPQLLVLAGFATYGVKLGLREIKAEKERVLQLRKEAEHGVESRGDSD